MLVLLISDGLIGLPTPMIVQSVTELGLLLRLGYLIRVHSMSKDLIIVLEACLDARIEPRCLLALCGAHIYRSINTALNDGVKLVINLILAILFRYELSQINRVAEIYSTTAFKIVEAIFQALAGWHEIFHLIRL